MEQIIKRADSVNSVLNGEFPAPAAILGIQKL
jgi:hypothetical protein